MNFLKQTSFVNRARKIQKFLSQPFQVAEVFTGMLGKFVPLKETISGFKQILDGKWDHLPEPAFYMVGGIEEVEAKAKSMAKDTKASKEGKKEKKSNDFKAIVEGAKKLAEKVMKKEIKRAGSNSAAVETIKQKMGQMGTRHCSRRTNYGYQDGYKRIQTSSCCSCQEVILKFITFLQDHLEGEFFFKKSCSSSLFPFFFLEELLYTNPVSDVKSNPHQSIKLHLGGTEVC